MTMSKRGPSRGLPLERTEEKKMTPEVAKILVDGLCRIVFIGGIALCIYAFIKGFFDR